MVTVGWWTVPCLSHIIPIINYPHPPHTHTLARSCCLPNNHQEWERWAGRQYHVFHWFVQAMGRRNGGLGDNPSALLFCILNRSTYPINVPYQHILSTHPINTPYHFKIWGQDVGLSDIPVFSHNFYYFPPLNLIFWLTRPSYCRTHNLTLTCS